jgi:hypothetical protein
MVYFGYEGEESKYLNYVELSHGSLSNSFCRTDLLNRFYVLRRELRAIDLRGHPEIRPFSAEHRSLLSEYNVVRMLINESLDLKHADKSKAERNVYVSYCLNDAPFTFDLVSDLEDYKRNVYGDSHELPQRERAAEEAAELCDTALFVLSRHTDKARLRADAAVLRKRAADRGTPRSVFVLAAPAVVPAFASPCIDLSRDYAGGLHKLIELISD